MNELLAAVAAWGLPTAHRLPAHPLDDETFAGLVSGCARERVLGLLGSAVRDGAVAVTAEQRAELDALWREWLDHSVRIERLTLDVLAALDRERVPAIVLKGIALGHTSYPDPGARVFGDVDVLVGPGSLHHAGITIMRALDGTRAEPELRPGFDDRFGRELMVRVGGLEVDLHRTFVNGAFGMRIDLAQLFADRVFTTIGGRPVPVLAPPHRLLHAAYGATLSDQPTRLVAVRDLAQVLYHDAPDQGVVVAEAAAWRAEAVLATAVTNAWRMLRLTDRPPLLEWAERHRTNATDRVLLACARGPARGYTSQLTSVLTIPGVAQRCAYLRALLFPSPEYRDARHLGRFGLIGAGARRARRA